MTPAWSWNALGHRLVAQIALDQLDKPTIKRLNKRNHAMDKVYPPMSLVNAATWLDVIRDYEVNWFGHYHYIGIPFSEDNSPLPTVSSANGLKAITMSQDLIKAQRATAFDQGTALRILMHVTGDLHQPIHAATRVSQAHPQGDMGGNLYELGANKIGSNLHSYWDRAGGYLLPAYPVKSAKLKKMARTLEKKWPCSRKTQSADPHVWVDESHQLAREVAYSINENTIPSTAYQQRVQNISMQRIALAGCRLGALLKKL